MGPTGAPEKKKVGRGRSVVQVVVGRSSRGGLPVNDKNVCKAYYGKVSTPNKTLLHSRQDKSLLLNTRKWD